MKRLKATSVLFMLVLSSLVLLVPAPETAEAGPMDIVPMGTGRIVLFEQFTAGGCGFCPPVSQGLQMMEANYDRSECVILSYHGSDPIGYSGTGTRMNNYGLTGYPSVVVDGVLHKVGGGGTAQYQYGLLEDLYDLRKNVPSELAITIEGELNPLTEMGDILVNVTAVDTPTEDNLFLHVVVFENQVDYAAPNGENVHDFVVRQMLNGTGGKSISLVKGQTLVNSFKFPFPSNQDPDEIGVIAFVQTSDRTVDGSRYDIPILQATYKKVVPIPNVPPVLSFGHMDTSNGDTQDDEVTFKALYKDVDDLKGNGPSEAKVYFKNATSSVFEHNLEPVLSADPWTEGRWLAWKTKLDPGVYTYRVAANDGEDDAVGDVDWNATQVTIKPRNKAPEVMDPGFVPLRGDTSTVFHFDIMYRDADNQQPVSAKIYIDAVGFDMTTDSTGPWNDWQVFYYETTLSVGENHKFYYVFSDGIDDTRYPDVMESPNWLMGPEVIPPNNEPSLTTAMFNPSDGTRMDEFAFTIIYTDGEDERPTTYFIYIDGTPYLMEGDSGDYSMGVTYRYWTTLDLGPHQVHYVFSDGKHEVRYPAMGDLDGPSVTNLAPLAVIKTPANDVRYTPDNHIPFSAIGSEDPEDDDMDFAWVSDIDGQFATTQVADKRLSKGTHIVTLTVTDEHGGEHTANVTVLVKPYLADPYLVDYKRTPDVPVEKDMIRYSVYLNNRGEKTASGLIVSFLVGNTYVGSETVTVPIETIKEVKFTWEAVAGEHTIAFEIPGDDLTFIEYVNINSVPTVQLSVVNEGDDRGRYEIGEEIYFKATVNDGDGDHMTYLWEFGDTATSTQSAPSHMYAKAGIYPVTLTVKDARGGEKVDTFDVVIKKEETSSSGGLGAGLIAGIVVVVLVIIVVIAIMMMRGRDGEAEEAAPAPEEPRPDVPDYLMPDAKPSTPPAVTEEPEFPDYSNGIPEEQPTGETSDDDYLGY